MDTPQPIVHWSVRGMALHPFHPRKPHTTDRDDVTCTLCLDLLKETA